MPPFHFLCHSPWAIKFFNIYIPNFKIKLSHVNSLIIKNGYLYLIVILEVNFTTSCKLNLVCFVVVACFNYFSFSFSLDF
jgi:hypothetical protein